MGLYIMIIFNFFNNIWDYCVIVFLCVISLDPLSIFYRITDCFTKFFMILLGYDKSVVLS